LFNRKIFLVPLLITSLLVAGAAVSMAADGAETDMNVSFTPNNLIDLNPSDNNYDFSINDLRDIDDENQVTETVGEISVYEYAGQNVNVYIESVSGGGANAQKRAKEAFEVKVDGGNWVDFNWKGSKERLLNKGSGSYKWHNQDLKFRWDLDDFNSVDVGTTFTYELVFVVE